MTEASLAIRPEVLPLFSNDEEERFKLQAAECREALRFFEKLGPITTDADEAKVNEIRAVAQVVLKQCELHEKAMLAPLKEQTHAIRATWAQITEPMERIKRELGRKLLAYGQARDERIARERAEARRKEEEAVQARLAAEEKIANATTSKERERALAQANKADVALQVARESEPLFAPRGVKTDHGTTYRTRGTPHWEIVAFDKVPDCYKTLNEKAVRAAMVAGKDDIPGLSLWWEEGLATRVTG